MWTRNRTDALLMLTLVSHLLLAIGFPVPVSARRVQDAVCTYPCQNRPCGCLTAEECWAGDCCCFTLEEKLAWAQNNAIEPPEHAKSVLQSRRSGHTSPQPRACCCEVEDTEADTETSPPECPDCPGCASSCCADPAPVVDLSSGARWVIGTFSQKCRGDGPAALLKFVPSLPAVRQTVTVAAPAPMAFLPGLERPIRSTTHTPPVPPPRCS